ncbi:MAG: hypothetical protein RXO36_05940 [Candidatus Nanopusillus acidilobi]
MEKVKWITKKDESGENKHIPIRPRKPFGVSREKALRDVEKLREMGLRARLIETNRKHKLYAPYEATIDEEGNPIPENETNIQKDEIIENKETEIKKENEVKTERVKKGKKSKIENMDSTTKTLYELGLLNEEGKLNITTKELKAFFDSNSNTDNIIHNLIEVNNDKIELLSMDLPHTIIIKKIIPNNTNLENGKYELDYNDVDKTFKLKKVEPNDTRRPPKDLNYKYDDGIDLHIDGEKYEKIRTILKNITTKEFTKKHNPMILIRKYKDSDKVKIKFYRDYFEGSESIYNDPELITEIDFNYPEGKDKTIFVKSNAILFDKTLTMVNGKDKHGSINLNLKTDYPLILHKEDSNKKEYGYLAPYFEE